MKKAVLLFCILLLGSKSFSQNTDSDKKKINTTLDSWHKAAANMEFDNYFSYMTTNGVFIGTDATENWQLDAFKAFSKPYFDKGKAWDFKCLQRNIYFDKSQNTAWFDELLDTQMKICRGSGVLIKQGNTWKIAHYVLSMTVPNDNLDEVVKIKEKIENGVIEKLKAK
ncbi:MAG: nuclear transport factor 2 family protein [Flavobacterium sp.]|jgi:ketosteroid isomerase-like protein|nr:nuclear transport factor 2 family protein [Flavobacterium sp.]